MEYVIFIMHTDFTFPSNNYMTLGYHQDVQQRFCKWKY